MGERKERDKGESSERGGKERKLTNISHLGNCHLVLAHSHAKGAEDDKFYNIIRNGIIVYRE